MWANDTLQEYQVRDDKRVLDVGCGDKVVTARLASFTPQGYIVGDDISAKIVHRSRKFWQA